MKSFKDSHNIFDDRQTLKINNGYGNWRMFYTPWNMKKKGISLTGSEEFMDVHFEICFNVMRGRKIEILFGLN